MIDGAKAQLEQAERDVARYTELVAKNATTLVTLNNAQTQVKISRAHRELQQGDAGKSEGPAQLSARSARRSPAGPASATVKVGNFVRQADTTPLATINPDFADLRDLHRAAAILPDIRQALAEETATVEAFMPGSTEPATGQVSMIENTVDPSTGMATSAPRCRIPMRCSGRERW